MGCLRENPQKMNDHVLVDREVALYSDDSHELSVLLPIADELERRGARVRASSGVDDAAEIGLYSSHTSRFFDFEARAWRRPPNALSVQSLHDLWDDGADANYFERETWSIFDLGLLPGPDWEGKWQRAREAGTKGPRLGMRVVGWPKMDHLESNPDSFASSVLRLRQELGVGKRPVALLACSWSDRRQLRDTLSVLDPKDIDIVVKYPASWLPPADSPWAKRLEQAYLEMKAARAEATANPAVIVADDDADIMALLALTDVVLSDGSNVMYEGVLAGVPGICIKDWLHPAGRHGERTVQPHIALLGIVSGNLSSLPTMLRVVRDPAWAALVQDGANVLVSPDTRGTAAARAADAIADALQRQDGHGSEPWSPSDSASLVEDDPISVMREALKQADEREARAREQLTVWEQELNATQEALKQADQREVRAREQLAAWEQELTALRAKVQGDSQYQ